MFAQKFQQTRDFGGENWRTDVLCQPILQVLLNRGEVSLIKFARFSCIVHQPRTFQN
jgi:hypothetical protein